MSLYVRLSREASETNLSRDGMLADLRELAAQLGLTVVGEHVDDGISGAVRDRPAFLAWLDDAVTGRADVLATWHADRVTREGVNAAARVLDVIEGKHPETGAVVRPPVRFLDCHGLDSAGDETAFRLRFVIAAEVARAERDRMRSRNRAAQARLRAAGRYAGGTPAWGTRAVDNPDGPGKVLDADPVEAPVLREAAERVVAGEPLGRVALWLTESGHAPRRAASWSRVTLRQALTSDAARELILGPALSRAVADAVAPKARDARKGGRQPSRLLSGGLIVCHACGTPLVVARRHDDVPTYRCPARSDGRGCTAPVVVSCERIEDYVSAEYLSAFGRLPYSVRRATVEGGDDLAAAQDAHAAALEALREGATVERFAALQAAEERLREAEGTPRRTVVRLVPTGRTVAEEWEAADVEGRRALLASALPAPVVLLPGRRGPRALDPARVRLSWREDDALDPDEEDAV